MISIIIGAIALTLFNIVIFATTVQRLRATGISWRKVFASLPTPMTGIAASYGVYAFNVIFLPAWVAAIEAAAFETVYIGLPALDNLTPEQHAKARKVAMYAGWVSFVQNIGSAFFYTAIGKKAIIGIEASSMWVSVPFFLVLATIHALMVWIGYHSAVLVFHRNAAPVAATLRAPELAQPDPQPTQLDAPQFATRVLSVRNRPSSMTGRRKLPQPETADAATSKVDSRARDWVARNDLGESYQAISNALGGSPTRQYISSECRKLRASMEATR